jgi:hypothetical protein
VGKTFKFNQYVKEAERPPFVLEISDGDTIEIEAPNGDTMLEIEEARSSRTTLELLAGEHSERILELIGPAPAGVMTDLVQDMLKHFGITKEQSPSGGSRASRRS